MNSSNSEDIRTQTHREEASLALLAGAQISLTAERSPSKLSVDGAIL
jgi:hypothetical protein